MFSTSPLTSLDSSKLIPTVCLNSSSLALRETLAEQHAARIFQKYYYQPYIKSPAAPEAIALNISRVIHGAQHVSRVAAYVVIFANLFKKYGEDTQENLTQEEVELLQIAMLFHDSAREDEGQDLWDRESALNFYHYVLEHQLCSEPMARKFAEAVANKDSQLNYFYLKENVDGVLGWENGIATERKSLLSIIAHDTDCLDIIRVYNYQFDAQKLHFYQGIASKSPEAFRELAFVVCEARSLIAHQEGSLFRYDLQVKANYEGHLDCYIRTIKDIINPEKVGCLERFPLLFANGQLLDKVFLKNLAAPDISPVELRFPLTDPELQQAMCAGQLAGRGISQPAFKQPRKKNSNKTNVEREIKKDWKESGNPRRSIALLGYGRLAFAQSGFLIVGLDKKRISKVSNGDCNSGYGKKSLLSNPYTIKDPSQQLSEEVWESFFKEHMLAQPHKAHIKMGKEVTLSYNEVLYDIMPNDIQGIYYAKEFTSTSSHVVNKLLPQKVCYIKGLLEAWYIQAEVYFTKKIQLPIYEYSAQRNFFRLDQTPFTFDVVKNLWENLLLEYLHYMEEEIYTLSSNDWQIIKAKATNCNSGDNSLDFYYPSEWQQALNNHLKEVIQIKLPALRANIFSQIWIKKDIDWEKCMSFLLKLPIVPEVLSLKFEKHILHTGWKAIITSYPPTTALYLDEETKQFIKEFNKNGYYPFLFDKYPFLALYSLAIKYNMKLLASTMEEEKDFYFRNYFVSEDRDYFITFNLITECVFIGYFYGKGSKLYNFLDAQYLLLDQLANNIIEGFSKQDEEQEPSKTIEILEKKWDAYDSLDKLWNKWFGIVKFLNFTANIVSFDFSNLLNKLYSNAAIPLYIACKYLDELGELELLKPDSILVTRLLKAISIRPTASIHILSVLSKYYSFSSKEVERQLFCLESSYEYIHECLKPTSERNAASCFSTCFSDIVVYLLTLKDAKITQEFSNIEKQLIYKILSFFNFDYSVVFDASHDVTYEKDFILSRFTKHDFLGPIPDIFLAEIEDKLKILKEQKQNIYDIRDLEKKWGNLKELNKQRTLALKGPGLKRTAASMQPSFWHSDEEVLAVSVPPNTIYKSTTNFYP